MKEINGCVWQAALRVCSQLSSARVPSLCPPQTQRCVRKTPTEISPALDLSRQQQQELPFTSPVPPLMNHDS